MTDHPTFPIPSRPSDQDLVRAVAAYLRTLPHREPTEPTPPPAPEPAERT